MSLSKKRIENQLNKLYKEAGSVSFKKPLNFRVSQQGSAVNPRLIKNSDFKEAFINQNGKPQLKSSTKDEFEFIDNVFNPFEVGDELYFYFDGYFFNIVKKDEYEAYLSQKEKEKALALQINELEKQRFLIEQKEQAEKFWKNYSIPFKFTTSIKVVLSGLSANSWGDGSKKNSQMHLFFLEDYSNGRLSRKRGEYLCSQPKNRFALEDIALDMAKESSKEVVSCPQCLKMMDKFKKGNCDAYYADFR